MLREVVKMNLHIAAGAPTGNLAMIERDNKGVLYRPSNISHRIGMF